MQSSVDYSGAQQRVIFEEYPIKQVVAAAGSGKTRTVIGLVEHRLMVGLEQPGSILLISFSRRAAGELRMRMRADLRSAVEIRTFHSFCYHKLRSHAPEFRDNPPRIIEDRERRAVLRALMRADPEAESIGGIPYSILIQQPAEFELHFPGMFRRVHAGYARYKREKNALEYADLIALMLDALRDDSIEWAARLRRRYSLILVDEFQDTDPRQLEFLKLMNPARIVTVGDARQSIYGFRGATLGPFLNFQKEFPGARIYDLNENYRSLSPIVGLSERVIRTARTRMPGKKTRAIRGQRRLPVLALRMSTGAESDLVARLSPAFERDPAGLRILVRTNFRGRQWERAGCTSSHWLTIHKSKGLEFPVVLLDMMGGWSSCHSTQNGRRALRKGRVRFDEEELRVLYVGCTRAMNLLVLLYRTDAEVGEIERHYYERIFANRVREIEAGELMPWLERARSLREM